MIRFTWRDWAVVVLQTGASVAAVFLSIWAILSLAASGPPAPMTAEHAAWYHACVGTDLARTAPCGDVVVKLQALDIPAPKALAPPRNAP